MPNIKTNEAVFTYWEGEEPDYIKLCWETIKKYAPDAIRLNENTCKDYIDLPKEYFKIKAINHRTDYLKAHLIYKYGGFWLDADTILLKPLPFGMMKGYFGTPGLFYAPKGDPTIKRWIDHMEVVIRSKSKFLWAELILPIVFKDHKKREIEKDFQIYIAPFYGQIIRDIFFKSARELESFNISNCFAIILYNEVFPKWFKEMSKTEILNADFIISELFRMAFTLGTQVPTRMTQNSLSGVIEKINEIIKYLEKEYEKKVSN